jgi:hypothetical protein
MFDVKQCEADEWKCEALINGTWEPVECLGVMRNNVVGVKPDRYPMLCYTDEYVRNIPPRVTRWMQLVTIHAPIRNMEGPVNIPLIEDSTGIRVDHSDAAIAALEGLNGKMPYFEGAAIVTSVILNAIAKIKKDRGE